jgi:hypothetical protein
MDLQRVPQPGEIYKHFKNKLYQIITIAIHTESKEQLVIYQALYGDYKIFARPLNMFISEVDRDKYPEASQKYRFELWGNNYYREPSLNSSTANTQEEASTTIHNKSEYEGENILLQDEGAVESGVNSVLLQFLDARSYNDKLEVLMSKKKYIDERLLNDMAISIDCTIEEGTIEERIKGLVFALETLARFENKRLR